jgi:hypothetical protein
LIGAKTPRSWAVLLTQLLDQTGGIGSSRFPVNVGMLSKEYTLQMFGDEHIAQVEGISVAGFEGSLIPFTDGSKRWGILYNLPRLPNAGRTRFTIAHEFGHFLLHRTSDSRNSFECSMRDVAGGTASAIAREREADEFAAWLLMPLNDYRSRINAKARPSMDDLSESAAHYGVSLLAAAVRWVKYTEIRAMIVVSRDGFIDWSISSDLALKTKAFIYSKKITVELPVGSAAFSEDIAAARHGIKLASSVWLGVSSTEMVVRSETYDLILSIIFLDDVEWTTLKD